MESIKKIDVAGQIGREADGAAAGDYRGEDGLLYCGKCRTPKQFRLPAGLPGLSGRLVPVACQCQKDAYAAAKQRREYDEQMRRIAELRNASLMEGRFQKSTFERFEETKENARVLKLCRRYVDRFDEMKMRNQGLLFLGEPGTGKTFAAACIANALLEKRVPLIMTSFVKLVSMLGYGRGEDEEDAIRRFQGAALLIVDDLGAERDTGYAAERVYNVLDSRYRAGKPMILTSNLTLAQMQTAADMRYRRIFDRVLETCYPVEFKGPSWRIAEAARRYDEMQAMLEA